MNESILAKIYYLATRRDLWNVDIPDYANIVMEMKKDGIYKCKNPHVSRDQIYSVTNYVAMLKEVKKCLSQN